MKKNIKLIIGLSLPILVIVIVLVLVIVQKMMFKPQFDFIYTIDPYCINYNCGYYNNFSWNAYKVVDGKIFKETVLPKANPNYPNYPNDKFEPQYPKIYKYSVKTNTFSEISLEDAQKITLTDGGSAPDGTVVVGDDNRISGGLFSEIFIGGYNSYRYAMYIKNGSLSKKIIVRNGNQDNYYGNRDFHLIGWVK